MEPLEQRALLSVAGIGSETFKTISFTTSGNVTSDFTDSGYKFHLTGTANLTQGRITYDSVDHGVIADDGARHGAILSVNNGRYTAAGKPNFSGTWRLKGYTDDIVDEAGQLTGTVVVQSSSMQIPTRPSVVNSFAGTYDVSNGAFNTRNFAFAMDLTRPDETTMRFKGKLKPTAKPFDVVVTPTWNPDGTIHADVRVPGQPHTTATADRSVPVTNVRVYWAQRNTLKSPALDSIPVYWNEASGSYTVSIDDYPDAPAGATGLAFVSRFDGKTKIAKLGLPAVSIASAQVAEGDSSDSAGLNHAAIPVTLSSPFTKDVTVSYATFKGPGDTARPGVDYVRTTGSIVIPAGQTQGQFDVPILGNTTYERNKTFSVKLTGSENARVLWRQSQTKGVITNDDPVPSIAIDDVTLAEGTPQGTVGRATKFVFTVTLSNPSYQRITVNYATADDSATILDKDYWRRTGVLTFNPGVLSRKISVIVKADAKVEEDESFFVRLSRPTRATLGDPQGLGTILNDDAASAQSAAALRGAALAQFAGPAELAPSFDPLERTKNGPRLGR